MRLTIYTDLFTLNISDFNLLFMSKLQPPPEKSHPPLSQQPPLKVEVLSSPSFLKIWLEVQPSPPQQKGEGVHTIQPI